VITESTSKLYSYELNGRGGNVIFPKPIGWDEAYRQLVVKFGDNVILRGYDGLPGIHTTKEALDDNEWSQSDLYT
jgi:hypothetical protein